MVIATLWRRVQVMKPNVWRDPIKERIYHRIAVIHLDAFELKISAQNSQTRRILTRSEPIQIQAHPPPLGPRYRRRIPKRVGSSPAVSQFKFKRPPSPVTPTS